MSIAFELDPSATNLLRAVGLLDADGQLDASWFEDPVGALGEILADPDQKAGLFALLDELLPPDDRAPAGTRWHPLLDVDGIGNLHLTITGDVVGLTAVAQAPEPDPADDLMPRAGIRVDLPLVNTAGGNVRPIAATSHGPIRVAVDLAFREQSGLPLDRLSVGATISINGDAGVEVVVEGVDVGAAEETVRLSTASTGAELAAGLLTLVRAVLEAVTEGDEIGYLLGVLGLGGGAARPPLPVVELFDDPAAAFRGWLAELAADEAVLRGWFGDLAQLAGGAAPLAGLPLRARIVELADDLWLEVTLAHVGDELHLGVDLAAVGDGRQITASVTVLAVPLIAGPQVRPVPHAAARVRVAGEGGAPLARAGAAADPDFQVLEIAGGITFDGTDVRPELVATGVVLAQGQAPRTIDLTDVSSVSSAASDAIGAAIRSALGTDGPAPALLALLGLAPPRTVPAAAAGNWPLLDLTTLTGGPTAAIAAYHREVLDSAAAASSWSHLLGELGELLGLGAAVTGGGTEPNPWAVTLAETGGVRVQVVAWDARTAADSAGDHRLRLGLRVVGDAAPWSGVGLSELLAFDLPAAGSGDVRLVGRQRAALTLTPAGPFEADDLTVDLARLEAGVDWSPGRPLHAELAVVDLQLSAGADTEGPATLRFDPALPDFGVPQIGADLWPLVRLLAFHALRSWGGDAAATIGSLVGLDGAHAPLELPAGGDLASLFDDPAQLLRDRLAALLLATEAGTGRPLVEELWTRLAALLRGEPDQPPASSLPPEVAPAPDPPGDAVVPDPEATPAAALPEPERPRFTVRGSGTYDDPWAVGLATGDDAEALELIGWLGPEGPPAGWAARLQSVLDAATTLDGASLLDLLGSARAFVDLPDAATLAAEGLGDAVDTLDGWLAAGDGIVPLSAQLPGFADWAEQQIPGIGHGALPGNAAAIAAIAAQLQAWAVADGAARPVLFLGPSWTDAAVWGPALAALAPAVTDRAAVHFDLRRGYLTSAVQAVATAYTADLDDTAGATPAELAAQAATAVDRILALTGAPAVTVIAHSTAGLVARELAALAPAKVAGLVTLGTPHDGAPPAVLAEPGLADAARLLRDLGSTQLGALHAHALGAIDAALDGLPGAVRAGDFVAVAPPPARGLAIGAVLGGSTLGAVRQALSARLSAAVAAGQPGAADPTHLGLGLRAVLPVDLTSAAGVTATAHARLDAAQVRFGGTAGTTTGHPDRALSIDLDVVRPGGWLVGDATSSGPRLRSATLGATFAPSPGGSVGVTPRIALRDATLGTLPPGLTGLPGRHDLGLTDPDLRAGLDLLAQALGGAGARADAAALAQLATTPSAFLRERRDALLDLFGTSVVVGVGFTAVELSVDPDTWTLSARTTEELVLGDGAGLAFAATVALAQGLTAAVDGTLRVGALRLAADSATGRVTLAADGWLPPLDLRPLPSPAALQAALVPLIPRVVLSSAASLALGSMLDTAATVLPVDALLRDPGAALRALDGDAIQALLEATATVLNLDASNGLLLPGDVLISASGADTIQLAVDATIDLGGANDQLTLGLVLAIDPARQVQVGGAVSLTLALLGGNPDWDGLTIDVGVSPQGVVSLSVTPEGLPAITLLPQFSGFAGLAAAAAGSLLPELLQALHDELDTVTPLRTAVLAIAQELGIYDAAAESFTGSPQITALRAMLDPGWFEAAVANPATLAGLVAALFGPGKIPLPAGHAVSTPGDRLRYAAPIPSPDVGSPDGLLIVETRLGPPPAIAIELTGLDVGPLVIDEVRAAFDGELEVAIAVHLDLVGDVAFLAPRLELGFSGGALRVALLPLGTDEEDDLAIVLAPEPDAVATEAGLLALLTQWGVPLATLLGVHATGDDVLRTVLWNGGPTPRSVLEGAGLLEVAPETDPAVVAADVPPLDQLVLGALQALVKGASIEVSPGLTLSLARDDAARRTGVNLKGALQVAADDGPDVSVRFGESWWLDDPGRGVTLWAIRDAPGATPPIALDPGLDVIGLGVVVGDAANASGELPAGSKPLIEGAVSVGQLGGALFFRLDFLDQAGNPQFAATEIGAAIEIDGAKITVDGGDGDAIVKKLIPNELRAPFDLAIEGRTGHGVELHGGIGSTPGAIELTFPLDLDLGGVIFLREIFLQGKEDSGGVAIVAALSANASLGPVAMNVKRVGIRAKIGPSGTRLEFKLPDGFGVSMDTSVITLGGYLLVDEPAGRYVGAVEIAIAKKFSLVAVAIITTKMPDGSEGFSFLFLIAITFPVPIPLGYGFFLAGVGGLLGLNRGVDLDRLRLGLRSGTADSILFPTDVVRRIDTIVRDLEEVFPIARDRFLIAPMAMITWSTPALITAKVGVIIEIGSPLRLGLLGVVQLALPDPKTPVVKINVAFLGALDIPGSMLSFDASIYDSSIGFDDFSLSLEGDIALRVTWGSKPDFVITIGGFHPSYTPGSHLRLPPMRRMSISLLKDNPRITLTTYFAITSNSVQLGAALELRLEAGGFSITGDAGFDVLVQIVPFKLIAHMWISLAVKAGSMNILTIDLDLTVEGPSPWIARGRASFSILFFSVTVRVEVTIGSAAPATLPLVSVLEKLLEAFADDAAWTATLGRGNELITLLPPAAGDLVLDAAGQLTVRQQLMPLGRDIGLFGTARPVDAKRVTVQSLQIGTRTATVAGGDLDEVTDAFAPGAFKPLTDQEKLTAAAYEQMPAGVCASGGTELSTDDALAHAVHYETHAFDTPAAATEPRPAPADDLRQPDGARFGKLARGGAIGRCAGALANARRQDQGSKLDFAPAEERYAVIATGDLRPRNAAGGLTFAEGDVQTFPRSVAEARRDALGDAKGGGFEILPEAQLVAP